MKILSKFTVLAMVVMALSSCGREKLTPIYQTVTINQLKKDKPINFSYQIDDTQIDEYAKNAAKFPLFGKLFQAIAIVLANSSISNSGGHDLELAAVDVDLSTLSAIDFDLIQLINLDSLIVSVRNAKSRDSLTFIDKLEIHLKLDSPIEGPPVDADGYSTIVYYDRAKDSLDCDGRCIKLNLASIDWKKLLQTNKLVHLRPKLVINSVPLSTMKLAGSIDFSVKFNLGF
ncbi:MAG: hypothetical protein PHY93_11275 [Bacteriovorax sp.]|nr:hypothetical protein [Bacteriovorax sp.]